ncbi:DUF6221 family protein [Actinacidiphila sp. bgisy145]|uniref:DUF6221 family protein n=1 Tax=Actinacidiphila sp. bgisy145 TaxID=3413792 RepID=UPI003EC0A2EF
MSADLTTFLRERVAEDEQIARDAATAFGDTWTVVDDAIRGSLEFTDVVAEPGSPAEYIAHYDAARALREVKAKRALMAMHRPIRAKDILGSGWTDDSLACEQETGPDDIAPTPFPCQTLQALAAVYADHSDYRDEWRS